MPMHNVRRKLLETLRLAGNQDKNENVDVSSRLLSPVLLFTTLNELQIPLLMVLKVLNCQFKLPRLVKNHVTFRRGNQKT